MHCSASRASSIQHPAFGDRPLIIPVFLPHLGCRHRCVFCNQTSITGADCKIPSPAGLRSQIHRYWEYRHKHRHPIQIAFFGGNFLGINPADVASLLRESTCYVNAGMVNSIRFSTRPDTIDRERLDMLSGFPVSTIELGAQSMDDEVLALTRRGHASSDTDNAMRLLKAYGYETGCQIMVGLPGDNPGKSLASAARIADLEPDFVRIYPTLVIADSVLAKWYQEGKYCPLPLEDAVAEVKKLYLFFKEKQIRVIRMGLQASADLENGSIVLAGPYHPAFGHLVYAEVFLDMAVLAIESANKEGESVTISVHPNSVAKMRGLNNRNIQKLKEKCQLRSVKIVPDDSLAEDKLKVCPHF